MLPKKNELNRMLKEAKDKKAQRAEEKRLKVQEEEARKKKEEAEKLEKDILERMDYIEKDILSRIKAGNNSTEFCFGDGRTPEPVWEAAVKRLRKANPDYNFEIKHTSVHCDNFLMAANVDGVNEREWWESIWELNITW